MAWCPKQTPNSGFCFSIAAFTISIQAPASSGVPGPGESNTPSKPFIDSALTSSFLFTTTSAPSCCKY